MPATFTTPFMSMVLPTVGVQVGPTWAADLNTALQVIDSHNHAPGSGSRIPAAGLNIDADLSFGGFNATGLNSTRYSSLTVPLAGVSDLGCVSNVNGDLYWNNGSGVAVKITSGAGINIASVGTIGGDYGQPAVNASVTYSNITKTFSFTQESNQTAKMFFGDLAIADTTAGSQAITIKAPAAAVAYNITLPATIPVATAFLAMDTSGEILKYAPVANGLTRNNFAAVGEQVSASSGTFSSAAAAYTDVTNLTVTLTTTGRPVYIGLIASGSSRAGIFAQINGTPSPQAAFDIRFLRGATPVFESGSIAEIPTAPANWRHMVGPGMFWHLDSVGAGTYTYKVQVLNNCLVANTNIDVYNTKLVAFEL